MILQGRGPGAPHSVRTAVALLGAALVSMTGAARAQDEVPAGEPPAESPLADDPTFEEAPLDAPMEPEAPASDPLEDSTPPGEGSSPNEGEVPLDAMPPEDPLPGEESTMPGLEAPAEAQPEPEGGYSAPIPVPEPLPEEPAQTAPVEAAEQEEEEEDTTATQVASEAQAVPVDEAKAARERRLFGTYRIRLGMGRPKFDDGLKYYEELYGKPTWFPTLQADWFAWDWYVTMGLSFKTGFYSVNGHTSKSDAREEGVEVEKDDNGPTTLTLVPAQVALIAEFTPFRGKWLVIDAYAGMERLYWQEVRTVSDDSSSTTTAMLQSETTTATDDEDADTNRGFKNASVVGVAANILLNPLDERSVNSMRGSMGLGFVYLTPFMEIVRTMEDDGVSFGRTLLGVGFTFETIR